MKKRKTRRTPRKVITFGAFDLLHEGHLKFLQQAKAEGDYLIVGVSSDEMTLSRGKPSLFSQEQRLSLVQGLRWVDEVFLEELSESKRDYLRHKHADLLVMDETWGGTFDEMPCKVKYLPRTAGISSAMIKAKIAGGNSCRRALFGDTYLTKHMDCALTMVNTLTQRNLAPVLTNQKNLPLQLDVDLLVYFNRPTLDPPVEYANLPRVLIDHGASHLKWFLGSRSRFEFFDSILTAGPDHVRSMQAIFSGHPDLDKLRATGFIKSRVLLQKPNMTRSEVCKHANLDPDLPIVLFVPTWHKSANADMVAAIDEIAGIPNHVASFHPETSNLPTEGVNTVHNINGITSELILHADIVVSDLSSTIYEAAALNKRVVQLLLKEYPDNPATLNDFPLTAGTAELFCGGLMCSAEKLGSAVRRVLADEPTAMALIEACRKRILSGTYIVEDAPDAIADQLLRISDPSSSHDDTADGGLAAAEPLPDSPYSVDSNLFFARQRLISHGCGTYSGARVSNSQEALQASLDKTHVVEVDLCLAKDGLIVAHDGQEERYGLSVPFSEVSVAQFLATKYEGTLTPVSLSEVIQQAACPGKAVVFDIKNHGKAYRKAAGLLREKIARHGHIERAVLQCYHPDDFTEAMQLGFQRVLLPSWKYFYRDPVGAEARAFFETCLDQNADAVWGLSIPYASKYINGTIIDHPEFLSLHAYWKRIFIHGAPLNTYSSLLSRNLGIFADCFNKQIEFKDMPSGFDWRTYLFLNPDLIRAGLVTEVQAAVHYLRHGMKEDRVIHYDLPPDFNFGDYLRRNPGLRGKDINGFNTAAAHYTRFRKN